MSGGSPVRSPVLVQQSSGGGGAVARLNNNDLDVTSFLPVLTTEYSDIMDESKYYFCINSLDKAAYLSGGPEISLKKGLFNPKK